MGVDQNEVAKLLPREHGDICSGHAPVSVRPATASCWRGCPHYSTVLSPVLLMTTELSLDEKLDPLDLLPLLELLDDEARD